MSAAATRKPRISFRWPLIGLLLLIAATSGFLGLEASREATQPLPVTQVAASHASLPPGTIERNGVRYRPIQTYHPCDRALGKNPELTDIDRANFGPEPNLATWKLLKLLAPKTDGTTADVSIVQPPEWLAEHNPQIGSTVPIWVPECGIDGNARVLSIAPCPPVKPGTSPVVLATFRHHVASTVDIHVTGLADPIGCTGNHPFWSETRQEFVRADELEEGERLFALGETAHVTRIELDPTPKFVYNLMVQGEHVYHVAQAGVLVHNSGECEVYARYVAPKVADLSWGRTGARQAAKAIEAGQTSIRVASRDDAAEVVWRMFSSRGFTNTTGRTGSDVRKILGTKAGTYHWDDVLDAAGDLAGHGADNVHGAMRHVQIHLESGDIVRIFFP